MRTIAWAIAALLFCPALFAQRAAGPPTPSEVKPASITCEDVPYPFDVAYLPLRLYGQDLRLAFLKEQAQ